MTSRLWRLLPALLLLCGPLSAARADEPVPDAATIRAKMRDPAPPSLPVLRVVVLTTSTDGSRVTQLRFRRNADWRDVIDDGPFHTERGSVKGDRWHENENGQVVFDQPEPSPEPSATAAANATVTRVHEPVEAFLVATLSPRGFGTKDYVDPVTWRLVRHELINSAGTTVTTYDDFRADHGAEFAHHWRIDSALIRTVSDSRVELFEPGAVQDRDVAMPSPRRQLVEFPPSVHRVELPTKFAPFGHVYVRVMIGDRGLDFILDSGAYGIALDMEVAKELGITPYGEHSTISAQRHELARAIVPEMHVGDLRMRNVMVHLQPQGWHEQTGVKAVGLLGFDFLAELGLTIDYQNKRVVAVPGDEYRAPSGPYVFPIEIRLAGGQPLTTVTLNGVPANRFMIDTGGVGTFLIHDYFARRHPEAIVDEGAGAQRRPIRFYGVGGAFDVRAYQIKSLRLGAINFSETVGYRVTSSGSYTVPTDGVIAPDFLRYFTLGLDYGNSRIYFVPNEAGRKAMAIK
ncbi:MAG TPA: aspartyl protease family protein [Candidatus Elarobacter sp.]|jgi:predicted aspartyl protease|nr:aspartyl protease family protein [Candidatus Elarobacter sp.]